VEVEVEEVGVEVRVLQGKSAALAVLAVSGQAEGAR
jgi:16S rRNA C1402 (ribose-2'-O) methylase RsmI